MKNVVGGSVCNAWMKKLQNVKNNYVFLSYKIIWMKYAHVYGLASGMCYMATFVFKKFYQTCVKTSPSLLIRSVFHKKTAYMLPAQVLWEMSSTMSTVQTAALVPVPPAQRNLFPFVWACLWPVFSCQHHNHQGPHPRAQIFIFLMGIFDFYINVRTVIKSNINSNSRLCLSCKYEVCCMVHSYLKYSYIKTDILPLPSFPTKLLLWTQNKTMRFQEDLVFLSTSLLVLTCHSISWDNVQIKN